MLFIQRFCAFLVKTDSIYCSLLNLRKVWCLVNTHGDSILILTLILRSLQQVVIQMQIAELETEQI